MWLGRRRDSCGATDLGLLQGTVQQDLLDDLVIVFGAKVALLQAI